MNPDGIKILLQTMHHYNTVKINQVFTTKDGHTLSVRCLPGTNTFEITNSHTEEILQDDSISTATEYINAFLVSHDLVSNS